MAAELPIDEDAERGAVTFRVLVVPGASRDALAGLHGDLLRVRVTAPPERGRANHALCGLLAAACGVRRGDVEVVSGAASRRKTVRIRAVSAAAVRAALSG